MAHGEDHLAYVLCLSLFLAVKGNAADLCDTIHDVRGLVAEVFSNGVYVHTCVFHCVVQKACRDGRLVKAHFGQDVGNGQRMGQIGFSGESCLSCVGRGGKDVGPLDHLQIGVLVQRLHLVENFLDAYHTMLSADLDTGRTKLSLMFLTSFSCSLNEGHCQDCESA